ncbi:MAG: hypothetical protein V9E88_01510 [Ferruginibacter sp.]
MTSTTDVTICTNQLPYSWNSQTYNAAGTFNVTLTSTSGCDSIATLNLTVNYSSDKYNRCNNLFKPTALHLEQSDLQCSWNFQCNVDINFRM